MSETSDPPGLMTAREVAALLGWPTWRTTRWIRSYEVGVKRGKRWFVTIETLANRFPEAAHLVRVRQEASRGLPRASESSQTIESRIALARARQESSDARIRALECGLREMRKEIRKLKRRLRKHRERSTPG